jgi:hypothetical protein
MIKNTFLIIALFSMVACTANNNLARVSQQEGKDKLNISKNIYIAISEDGKTDQGMFDVLTPFYNSGQAASDITYAKLFKLQTNAIQAAKQEDINVALVSASKAGAEYLVYPKVIYWGNANTSNCSSSTDIKTSSNKGKGFVDEVNVDIYVYSTKTKKLVRKDSLIANGCKYKILGTINYGTLTPEQKYAMAVDEWVKENIIRN